MNKSFDSRIRAKKDESGKTTQAKILAGFALAVMVISVISSMVMVTGIVGHGTAANSTAKTMSASQGTAEIENHGVNPFSYYQKEPAPMGIADFGVGRGMSPYSYNTSSFVGNIHLINLQINGTSAGGLANDVVNGSGDVFLPISSQLAGDIGMTAQLNVNFQFVDGGTLYDYWIQDVAVISPNNSTSSNVSFENNIWNFSSPNASMKSSTIQGNGSVGTFIGTGYYAASANSSLPGNDVSVNYPSSILLRVNSAMSSRGVPEVIFQYNDGFGWITYDNAYFIFAKDVTHYYRYVVDGYTMNPGNLFYDAELILGGPGDGLYVSSGPSTQIFMTLKFWNGNNYQYVPNAFNFGSDTAESMSYVTDAASFSSSSGTVGNLILGGSQGKLSMTYNSTETSTLSVIAMIQSGTVSMNGKNYTFTGGSANLTLSPGTYTVNIYTSRGSPVFSHIVTLYPNQTLVLNTLNYYPVEFIEKGLPSGTSWAVTLGSVTQESNTNTITMYLQNGTYNFSAEKFSKYYILAPSSVTVDGKQVSVSVTYSKVVYQVSFDESGLPTGAQWYVSLSSGQSNSATGSVISFNELNGTYSYAVKFSGSGYKASPASGTITVNGASVSVHIDFSSTYTYAISFQENGLPADTQWSITLGGITSASSGGTITFLVTNGTYSYSVGSPHGYNASPSHGSITVNGNDIKITVSFATSPQYLVIFQSKGLPDGTEWSVTIGGEIASSDGQQIIFQEVNGYYNFSVGDVAGYTGSPQQGEIHVNGENQQIDIVFVQKMYTVTFTETGLPPGSEWSVDLNGITHNSTNSTIVFTEPDGTYSFSVYSIVLYGAFVADPSNGTVTVSNANASQSVTFIPNASGIVSTASPALPIVIPLGTVGGGLTATMFTRRIFGRRVKR